MGLRSKFVPDSDIARLLVDAGFRGESAIVAFCIVIAESGGDTWAINMNTHAPEADTYLSLDKGLVQFNDYWWPIAQSSDAFVPELAIAEFFVASKEGTDFQPWVAYKNFSFVRHVERAYDSFANIIF